MPRGGRSYGRSSFGHHGHSSYGHHHHHHYGGGGGGSISNSAAIFGATVDLIANTNMPPTLLNGVYKLSGSQINVTNRLNDPTSAAIAPMVPMMPMMMGQPNMSLMPMQATPVQGVQMTSMMAPQMSNSQVATQADITVVGTKTSEGSGVCFYTTIILASLIIIPFFFMCCMWWKKIVYPKYEMSAEFYRVLGTFLRRETQVKMLNLTVIDNTFNAEKARLLYQSLAGSQLTGFSFVNLALACNHNENEADSFTTNVMPLKSLSFPSQISWDDMIV